MKKLDRIVVNMGLGEAIADKKRALDIPVLKQGQRLLQKADNTALKASKEKDAANDKIEKLQSKIFKSSIKKR